MNMMLFIFLGCAGLIGAVQEEVSREESLDFILQQAQYAARLSSSVAIDMDEGLEVKVISLRCFMLDSIYSDTPNKPSKERIAQTRVHLRNFQGRSDCERLIESRGERVYADVLEIIRSDKEEEIQSIRRRVQDIEKELEGKYKEQVTITQPWLCSFMESLESSDEGLLKEVGGLHAELRQSVEGINICMCKLNIAQEGLVEEYERALLKRLKDLTSS